MKQGGFYAKTIWTIDRSKYLKEVILKVMLLYINLLCEYQIRGPYMQDKGGKGAGPLVSIIAKDVLLLQSFLNRIYWIH